MSSGFDFRKVDLNLLIIFDAIYANRNISLAAAQLGMSQPTMSNALARLRGQLGDQLFVRLDRGVSPTAFAENIVGPVRSALTLLRTGLQPVEEFAVGHTERVFRVAMHGFSIVSLLPPLLREIERDAPGIVIEVVSQDWLNPFEGLISGKLDLAVDAFPQEDPQIGFDPLYDIEPVAILRAGHPVVDGVLTPEAFANIGHVILPQEVRRRAQVDSALISEGLSRRVVCQASSTSDLGPIVATTDLLAIVPARYAHSAAGFYKLQVLKLPFTIRSPMLLSGWLRRRENDSGLAWLRSRIQKIASLPAGEAVAAF